MRQENSPNKLARGIAVVVALGVGGLVTSEVMTSNASPDVRPSSLCNPDLGDVCTPVTDPETGSTIPLTLPEKEATTTTVVETTSTTVPETTTTVAPTTTVVETTIPPTVPVPETVPGHTA